MKERYSCYDFQILCKWIDGDWRYVYEIYGYGFPPYDDGIIESDEWFESKGEARLAAIGHISKLEDGHDYD